MRCDHRQYLSRVRPNLSKNNYNTTGGIEKN